MFSFCLFIFYFCFAAAVSSGDLGDDVAVSGSDKVRVHFFNVGQGHCFFFFAKHTGFNDISNLANDPADIAILIDAGSTSIIDILTQIRINPELRQSEIRSKIKRYIGPITKVLIIATHGDGDHYNWMKDILTESFVEVVSPRKRKTVEAPIFSPMNVLCILGGNIKDYDLSFFPNAIQTACVSAASSITAPRNTEENVELMRRITERAERAVRAVARQEEVLLDELEQSSKVREDAVLLMKIICFNVKACYFNHINPHFLSHEDKLRVIENMIVEHLDEPSISVRVLSAMESELTDRGKNVSSIITQNGSAAEDSNNENWLRVVQPEFMVFSHGITQNYHPHTEVMIRSLRLLRGGAAITKDHVLFYGVPKRDDPAISDSLVCQHFGNRYMHTLSCFTGMLDRYKMMWTNCNVFSTCTGDIEFIIDDVGIRHFTREVEFLRYLLSSLKQYITQLNFRGFPELARVFLELNITPGQMPALQEVDFTSVAFNSIAAVPVVTSVEDVSQQDEEDAEDSRTIVAAGTPIPQVLLDRFRETFPGVVIASSGGSASTADVVASGGEVTDVVNKLKPRSRCQQFYRNRSNTTQYCSLTKGRRSVYG